jgi:hypothetical protein
VFRSLRLRESRQTNGKRDPLAGHIRKKKNSGIARQVEKRGQASAVIKVFKVFQGSAGASPHFSTGC